MNPAQARQLIKDTFTQPFDRDRFGKFAANLLNHVDGEKAFRQTLIKEAYRAGISHYERLGTYTDPDGEKIDVLTVHMKKETGIRRARTFQRNFVADYLLTRGQKEAALVAFVSPDSEDWRFSLVKMEYRAEAETAAPTALDGGPKQTPPKVVVRTDLTPAVRLSFLVGRNERSHTAQAQLVKILADTEHDPTLATLEQAFSVETVSDEFFEQYRILFLRLRQAVDAVSAKDANVRSEFVVKDISPVDFSKKLLGQIVFLYFLQKKGWLGLTRKQAWGDGPRDFLRQLFDGKVIPYKNFFNDVLEPLFYEALAKEHDEDFNTHFQRKIPFLNGGLFDPIRDYDWVETDILLPNDLFANSQPAAHGDIGTGILDVFDRFNFTVDEAEPLEKEVAVDPEMLGKVFERLLDVQERKGKGSFYTPREIVRYMCRQSLSYCLQHRMTGKCTADDIARFLDLGDRSADFEANLNDTHWNKRLPDSVREHAADIDAVLENLAVCDPAIGSGAFPVGMLLELVRAREILASLDKMPSRSRYELKSHAIQNCLYGVDIDPGAVDVAKLRLWLSLVGDEHDRSRIEPLPNLDYKIMQGNSLLDTFEGTKLFDASLLPESNAQTDRRIEEIKSKIVEWQRTLVELHKASKLSRVKRKEIEQEVKKLQDRLAALNGDNGQVAKAVVRENVVRDDYLTAAFSGASLRKAQELRELHKVFFQTTSRQKRRELRRKLDTLEWDFIAATLREQGQTEAEKELAKQRNAAVKPFFLWQLHFAEVFQDKGGFDIVIGNPPYRGFHSTTAAEKAVLAARYRTAHGKFDIYLPFIELGLDLMRARGVLCFICPTAFTKRDHGEELRRVLVSETTLLELIDFEHSQMFEDVTNYTGILLFQKGTTTESVFRVRSGFTRTETVMKQRDLDSAPWIVLSDERRRVADLMMAHPTLGSMTTVSEGIVTGLNRLYLQKAAELRNLDIETELFFPCIRGREIARFGVAEPCEMVFYPYQLQEGKTVPIPEDVFREGNPRLYRFLNTHRKEIMSRGYFRKSAKAWYELWNQRQMHSFVGEKIVTPELSDRNRFAIAHGKVMYGDTVCGISLGEDHDRQVSLWYLLAVLNSSLVEWLYKRTTVCKAGGFFIYKVMFLRQIPIPIPNHNRMTELQRLAQMMARGAASGEDGRPSTSMEELDELVFALYDIPDELRDVVRVDQGLQNEKTR